MRRRSSTSLVVLALALAFGVSACASGGGGGGSRPAGATNNRIVKAELEPLSALDAYQAIQRLRPQWLQSRSGEPPVLYVDGARRSNLGDLQTMRSMNVEQMEYMSATDASNRYGTGHNGGAILVTSSR